MHILMRSNMLKMKKQLLIDWGYFHAQAWLSIEKEILMRQLTMLHKINVYSCMVE